MFPRPIMSEERNLIAVEVFDVTGRSMINQAGVTDLGLVDNYFLIKTKEKDYYINANSIQRVEVIYES